MKASRLHQVNFFRILHGEKPLTVGQYRYRVRKLRLTQRRLKFSDSRSGKGKSI